MTNSSPKVAIVHDWILCMRGAERTLDEMCRVFPDADIYTLFYEDRDISENILSRTIHSSFLQKFPGRRKYFPMMLPLMPLAVEHFNLEGYDIVISSSWCCSKGVIVPSETLHVGYVFTPMRFAWDLQDEYFGPNARGSGIKKALIKAALHGMRMWDVSASLRPDIMLAASEFVQRRIKKAYGLDSRVVWPPVDIERFHPGRLSEDYYLMVTSFEPNKRVHLAVETFNELGFELKIVGEQGRDRDALEKAAGENITFLGRVSDEELASLYRKARAFIHPSVEDFGISPIEAMASGTPVIGYSKSGLGETVVDISEATPNSVPTGVLIDDVNTRALKDAIQKVTDYGKDVGWDKAGMRTHAQKFSSKGFRTKFKDVIIRAWEGYK